MFLSFICVQGKWFNERGSQTKMTTEKKVFDYINCCCHRLLFQNQLQKCEQHMYSKTEMTANVANLCIQEKYCHDCTSACPKNVWSHIYGYVFHATGKVWVVIFPPRRNQQNGTWRNPWRTGEVEQSLKAPDQFTYTFYEGYGPSSWWSEKHSWTCGVCSIEF